MSISVCLCQHGSFPVVMLTWVIVIHAICSYFQFEFLFDQLSLELVQVGPELSATEFVFKDLS